MGRVRVVAVGSLLVAALAGCGSSVPKGWQRVHLPVTLSEVVSVSCPSPTRCIAAGDETGKSGEVTGDLLYSTGDMERWNLTKKVAGTRFDTVACSGPVCSALGGSGEGGGLATSTPAVYQSNDGGQSWQGEETGLGEPGEMVAMSCPTRLFCVAVGNSSEQTAFSAISADGGVRWGSETTLPGLAAASGLSCPSVNRCIVVGGTMMAGFPTGAALDVSTDGGRSWAPGAMPTGLGAFTAIGCQSAIHCITVGSADIHGTRPSIMRTVDGGQTWKHVTISPRVSLPITSLACTKGAGCVAGTASGHILVQATSTGWRDQLISRAGMSILGLSCPTRHLCVTAGIVVNKSGPAGAVSVNRQGT